MQKLRYALFLLRIYLTGKGMRDLGAAFGLGLAVGSLQSWLMGLGILCSIALALAYIHRLASGPKAARPTFVKLRVDYEDGGFMGLVFPMQNGSNLQPFSTPDGLVQHMKVTVELLSADQAGAISKKGLEPEKT